MELTYVIVMGIVAYAFGAITKACIEEIPNKFIPLQNLLLGIVSGLICYFLKIEPNLVQALALCIIASMGAGGAADLVNIKNKESEKNERK